MVFGSLHIYLCITFTQKCIGSGGVSAAGCSLPGSSISPLTTRERAWLTWFGRFRDGVLHVESVRMGPHVRMALHLHDATTSDCIACAVQTSHDDLHVSHLATAAACGEQRLLGAVQEFRHRAALVRRFCVVDGSRDPGQSLNIFLGTLPSCVRRKRGT